MPTKLIELCTLKDPCLLLLPAVSCPSEGSGCFGRWAYSNGSTQLATLIAEPTSKY